jgi:hypothetical protein
MLKKKNTVFIGPIPFFNLQLTCELVLTQEKTKYNRQKAVFLSQHLATMA